MKVILTKQVDKVGAAHEVKEVSDGFARNFLLKKGLAVLATPGEMLKLEANKATIEAQRAEDKGGAEAAAKQLKDLTLKLELETNDKGTLFAAFSADEVVEKLKADAQIDIAASTLSIKKPIKETGSHEIAYDLGFGIKGTFILDISSQKS